MARKKKVICPECGAKNAADVRRCRVCTNLLNLDAPEEGRKHRDVVVPSAQATADEAASKPFDPDELHRSMRGPGVPAPPPPGPPPVDGGPMEAPVPEARRGPVGSLGPIDSSFAPAEGPTEPLLGPSAAPPPSATFAADGPPAAPPPPPPPPPADDRLVGVPGIEFAPSAVPPAPEVPPVPDEPYQPLDAVAGIEIDVPSRHGAGGPPPVVEESFESFTPIEIDVPTRHGAPPPVMSDDPDESFDPDDLTIEPPR